MIPRGVFPGLYLRSINCHIISSFFSNNNTQLPVRCKQFFVCAPHSNVQKYFKKPFERERVHTQMVTRVAGKQWVSMKFLCVRIIVLSKEATLCPIDAAPSISSVPHRRYFAILNLSIVEEKQWNAFVSPVGRHDVTTTEFQFVVIYFLMRFSADFHWTVFKFRQTKSSFLLNGFVLQHFYGV